MSVRPLSSDYWLLLADMRLQAGQPIAKVADAMRFSALTGANEHDVMVQRGTMHNWVNRGPAPCLLAVVLIDAKPVEVGGKTLNAVG